MSWTDNLPLPGEQEAKDLGYFMYCYSGDHHRATYLKDNISLEIWYSENGLEAKLSFVHRLLVVSTFAGSGFLFPHPNFAVFEKQIQDVKRAITEYDSRGELFR